MIGSQGLEIHHIMKNALQVSLWNFIRYNVVGGGDSALYGVEAASFYLRNGVLNLNIALPLAALSPVALFLRSTRSAGQHGFATLDHICRSPRLRKLSELDYHNVRQSQYAFVVMPTMS